MTANGFEEDDNLVTDAPFRVSGYDDMCVEFDIPYHSLVQAAQEYLERVRSGYYGIVCFEDNRYGKGGVKSPLSRRLREIAYR